MFPEALARIQAGVSGCYCKASRGGRVEETVMRGGGGVLRTVRLEKIHLRMLYKIIRRFIFLVYKVHF